MPAPSDNRDADLVRRRVDALRRRALCIEGLRSVTLTAAATSALLVLASSLAGPAVSSLMAGLLWMLVTGCAVAMAVWRLAPLRDYLGHGAARLLGNTRPELASMTRSTLEFAAMGAEGSSFSPSLLAAQAGEVWRQIEQVRPAETVRPDRRWLRDTCLALAVILLCTSLLQFTHWGASGFYALRHSGASAENGRAMASLVSRLRVTVLPPAHIDGPVIELDTPGRIEVAAGSTVALELGTRFDARAAMVTLGKLELPLTRKSARLFTLQFTADESADLRMSARSTDDEWLTEPEVRPLIVLPDAAPEITLRSPEGDGTAGAASTLPVTFIARDDHGLQAVDLVVRGPGSTERRFSLSRFPEHPGPTTHEDSHLFQLSQIPLRSGNIISLWVEARDWDRNAGPNVGRSAIRTLTIGRLEDSEGRHARKLAQVLDSLLAALADRLESEFPATSSKARARARTLTGSVREASRELDLLWRAMRADAEVNETASLIRAMVRRLRRLRRQEAQLASENNKRAALLKMNGRLVREFENGSLWVADLLGRARIDRARRAVAELEQARRRMEKLLDQMKRSSSAADRRALLAEIARARASLQELSRRLMHMRSTVPGDFMNADALQRSPGREDNLAKLETAVQQGELDQARQALAQLEEQLNSLRNGIEATGEAHTAARFRPRSRALERAMFSLGELALAQRALADDTAQINRRSVQRAAESAASDLRLKHLASEGRQMAQELEALINPEAADPHQAEGRNAGLRRIEDARDALKSADLYEARAMAERASQQIETIAHELTMDARFFSEDSPRTRQRAERARQLAESSEQWAKQIESLIPDDGQVLAPGEKQSLLQQAPRQQGISKRAREVQEKLGQLSSEEGIPGNVPEQLGEAIEYMDRASEALRQPKPASAQDHQREVLDRLAKLKEQLQRQAQVARGQGSGTGQQQRDGERVKIPQRGNDARRRALRRRVLDARRARVPAGYEEAVDQYYEEILR